MKPLYIVLFCCSLLACRKDDTGVVLTMPAKTQTGQHTFGFLLNSEVWTNYNKVCFLTTGCRENLDGIYYTNDGDVHVRADKVLHKNSGLSSTESIDLYLNTRFRGTGTYSIANGDTLMISYRRSETGSQDVTYLLSSLNPSFTITLDRIDPANKILSGTFSGKLFKQMNSASAATSATDSLMVTDGRFDIKVK
ncbi:hypothetical protein [Sediminibacterium ginsengisoli]|uniref:Uncharacterized protein n=1 Tax=Sediminibacterium ginsengisoli TaxID=413434 RepID=A0A1T4QIC1_9BACT|nr:hypothetical protein [Sediminibacterium ginsengisoli]SKA03387.1 hypothetical protein SAMN04488132_108147 [Sediminibacterium ginsengisoli]